MVFADVYEGLKGEHIVAAPHNDPNPNLVRTGEAIAARFKRIGNDCLEFQSIESRLRTAKPAGNPSDEKFARTATALLNDKGTIENMYKLFRDQEDVGHPFVHLSELK